MGRPAKVMSANSSKMSKEDKAIRQEVENKIKGTSIKLVAPKYLTKEQKKIFNKIKKDLDDAKILGNLDNYMLTETSIALDRMAKLDAMANEDFEMLLNPSFKNALSNAQNTFFKCCNELCLSPQSRAKLSISAVKSEEKKKTLMDLLNEDDDE